jgi:uncharacterized repeat protein (TIGR03843 family)
MDGTAMGNRRVSMDDRTTRRSQRFRNNESSQPPTGVDITRRLPVRRDILETLQHAPIGECKLVPWGSNYTFAVGLEQPDGSSLIGIYKPTSGEIPLWDFDSGSLYLREYASYLLSRVLGWHFIPETVIRDGPHGTGTVQLYVEPAQGAQGRLVEERYSRALERIFVFDLLVNNADRKSSHFFIGKNDRRLWGIDHGLTFHVHPKLRTVIWDFCGEPFDPCLKDGIDRLIRHFSNVGSLLAPYLRDEEIDMLFTRASQMQTLERLPSLHPRRNVPFGW